MSMIEKRHKWVDIGSAASATGDDLVRDDGDLVLRIVQSRIWLDHKGEWEL